MSTPKVSIIVPVYKAEKTIRRCVDSILHQTNVDFELLLIDDGSPDRSGELCDEYAAIDNRVRVFHKKNGGVSSARNMGLDNAIGEWVAFVDSDDEIEPDYLQRFAGYKNAIQSKVLVVQRIKIISDDNLMFTLPKGDSGCKSICDYILSGQYGYPVSKIFLKHIINENKLRFDESVKCHEDELFVLDYLKLVDKVLILSWAGYLYYKPENFNEKYSKSITWETNMKLFERQYPLLDDTKKSKFHIYYNLLHSTVVQAIVEMKKGYTFSNAQIERLINATRKDILHIKGRRRVLLRLLHFTSSQKVWRTILRLHTYLIK